MGIVQDILDRVFGGGVQVAAPAPVPARASMPAEKPAHRPVIAVSGSSSSSKSVAAMMTQLRSAGVTPVFIGEHAGRIAGGVQEAVVRDLGKVDGLVVLGNDDDIDPAKYGQKALPTTHVEKPERAAYEEAAIQFALTKKMPLVTVCAGMQRLNVLGGGSLMQSVPDVVGDGHHNQGKVAPFVPVQLVQIDENSKLAGIAGVNQHLYTPTRSPLPDNIIMENSFHHQAVDKVRDDFVASARSDDGLVEAIEPKAGSKYADQFVVGVQWHPEFGASEFGASLAGKFSAAAANYSQVKDAVPTLFGMPLEVGEHAQKFASTRSGGRATVIAAVTANPTQPTVSSVGP